MFRFLPHLLFELAVGLILRLRRTCLHLGLHMIMTGLSRQHFAHTQLPDVLVDVLLLARGALEKEFLRE